MTTTTRETRRDRLALAREAGFGRFSFVAVVAGMLVAYGAFAVIAAIAGSVVEAIDAEANVSDYDWDTVSLVGGLVLAAVLFLSYFFGGYVAGRMARRAGLLNGVAVFVLGVIVAAVVGGVAAALTDTDQVQENLRNVGIPTTADDWKNLGSTIGGIAAILLMLLGAVLGAMKGERWHGKLLDRALDPEYGPEAERRRAAVAETEAADAEWRRREARMQATDDTRRTAVAGPATTAVPAAAGVPTTATPVTDTGTTADDEVLARRQAEEQLAAERTEQIDLTDRPTGGATSAVQEPVQEPVQPVERRR
jgi:hypothetical protein